MFAPAMGKKKGKGKGKGKGQAAEGRPPAAKTEEDAIGAEVDDLLGSALAEATEGGGGGSEAAPPAENGGHTNGLEGGPGTPNGSPAPNGTPVEKPQANGNGTPAPAAESPGAGEEAVTPKSGLKAECWVCTVKDDVESMIEPCNCLGDRQYAHVDCWQGWVAEDFDSRDIGCQICESNWKMDTVEEKIEKIELKDVDTSDLPAEFQKAAMSDRLERVLYTSWFRISTKQASEREKRILREVGCKVPGPWTKWIQQDYKRRNSIMGKVGNAIEAQRERRASVQMQRSLTMGTATPGAMQRRASMSRRASMGPRRGSIFGNANTVFHMCRICKQNDEVFNLVEPCYCTDKELKFVHIKCWQKSVRPDTPEGEEMNPGEIQKVCEYCMKEWKVDPTMEFTVTETEDDAGPEVSDRLMRALECAWFRVSTGQAGEREVNILADAGSKVPGPWDRWVKKTERKQNRAGSLPSSPTPESLLDNTGEDTSEKGVCKICQKEESIKSLISPCNCEGDMKYTHVDCWTKFIKDDPETRKEKCLMCDSEWKAQIDMGEYGMPQVQASERLMRALQTAWFRISTGGCGPMELELVMQAGSKIPGPWTKWIQKREKRRSSIIGRVMDRSISMGPNSPTSPQGPDASFAAAAMMDPVEAAKMAAAAASAQENDKHEEDENVVETEERASQEQLKMIRLKSLRQRKEQGYKPNLDGHTEVKRERDSILQRTSILFVGDQQKGKKGLFSCCFGGSKMSKYEVEDNPHEEEEEEEEEEDGW